MSSDSEESLWEAHGQRTPFIIRSEDMESQADHRIHKRYNALYGLASGLGVLVVLLMLIWIVTYQNGFGIADPNKEFYWHPMLMVLGLVFMYAQSMLVYRTVRYAKKKLLKLTHAALHGLAFILTVLALKAAFDSHNYSVPPKPNLYTLHSWVGLIAVILFAYQFLSGFLTFLFPGMSPEIRSTYLPVHSYFGSGIFALVIVAAMMGIAEKAIWSVKDYTNATGEAVLVNFMGVVLALFGALVMYLVNDPLYKRVAVPEDEINLPSGLQ